MQFNWYSKIINSNQIEQGDFINDCPIILPPSKIIEGNTSDFKIVLLNSIVLTQSCDLANNKVKIVLVCPYFSLKTFTKLFKNPYNICNKCYQYKDNIQYFANTLFTNY